MHKAFCPPFICNPFDRLRYDEKKYIKNRKIYAYMWLTHVFVPSSKKKKKKKTYLFEKIINKKLSSSVLTGPYTIIIIIITMIFACFMPHKYILWLLCWLDCCVVLMLFDEIWEIHNMRIAKIMWFFFIFDAFGCTYMSFTHTFTFDNEDKDINFPRQ